MRDQRIRDPIHNLIKFSKERSEDQILWRLVQTQEFQRLRRIRQLGFSDLVYPGATHTRFSHSLGAMQTARKMLAVFLRNRVVGDSGDPDNQLWQTATLCAALLHDVGHGPFSHVFEEVSKKCGIEIHHEDWTSKIINEGSVQAVLSSVPDLLPRTLSFFTQEPGNNLYSRIVSSQLDADRLDFLLRDKYFTGVHFGAIDPEWIFDCLRIEELLVEPDSEVRQFTFVVSAKGLAAIENYLYAYSELYSKVYFHKTTRAAQIMLQEILLATLTDPSVRAKLPEHDPVKQYFEAGRKPSLSHYLKMDDFALWNTISFIASADLGPATGLAQRLLTRDLYKCFDPPHKPDETLNPIQVNEFAAKLRKKEIPFFWDKIPEKGYKIYVGEGMVYLKNILVDNERDRKPASISSLSRLVSQIADPPATRFYFPSQADKEAAVALWQ